MKPLFGNGGNDKNMYSAKTTKIVPVKNMAVESSIALKSSILLACFDYKN